MSWYFSKRVSLPFAAAVDHAIAGLKAQGFGVLTDVDVQRTLKDKIGADFRPYRILGACMPLMAHRSLLAEAQVGLMLPCNVVVQAMDDGAVEVSAIDPLAAMAGIDNPALREVAGEVSALLRAFVEGL